MANYPTSVFNPASRSNGQTIDASHVNDLQGEVTAIEDGIRNATAPLNSSNSTVASLSVLGNAVIAGSLTVGGSPVVGGSTFGSVQVTGGSTVTTLQAGASTLASLSVSGNSTLAALQAGASTLVSLSVSGVSTLASLQVAGGSTFAARPVTPAPHAAGVITTGVIHLTNNTTLAVAWMGQAFQTNSSMHSTGSTPSVVTPQSSGIWAFNVALAISLPLTASTGSFVGLVEDSSGTLIARVAAGAQQDGFGLSGVKYFDAVGGSLRVVARVRDSATNSIAVAGTYLQVYKL